jgi:hypothetical protein
VVRLELIADSLKAWGIRVWRALERNREGLERLARFHEGPAGRLLHAPSQRSRESIGLVVGILGPQGEHIDGNGTGARWIGTGRTSRENRRERDEKSNDQCDRPWHA